MEKAEIFKVTEVPLRGSNLIEASAGTGKTYSIAILLLRLLLEKELLLKEVLMVTFTKAAVAELEERIRLFVRSAAKAAAGKAIGDATISGIVADATEKLGAEKVGLLLDRAVLLLDDTAVMTIHKFCQQTLNEFAFETGQLFGCETLDDIQTLIDDEVNKFWRTNVTGIRRDLLRALRDNGLSRGNFAAVLAGHFGGKRYITYRDGENYRISTAEMDEAWQTMEQAVAEAEASRQALYERIRNDEGNLAALTAANRYAHPALSHLLDDPAAFIAEIKKKRGSGYIGTLYGHFLEASDHIDRLAGEISAGCQQVISRLCCQNIQEAAAGISAFKNRNSVLSFDDMISGLHNAVTKPESGGLIASLRKKYKAVFVDEFQDTDKLQYEIFQRVFGEGTVLFYIGDPKQSIYGWRKADIHTYLKAGMAVDSRFNMNINFRSCPSYITAMNVFFVPETGFDTFAFSGQEDMFGYIPVDAPEGKTTPGLLRAGAGDAPILIFECPNNGLLAEAVARQVLDLLEDSAYSLPGENGSRRVRPADIGILVRKNKQGRELKRALAGLGIPAINIDETKILDSDEAAQLLFVLQAIHEPGRGSINKALLGPFTGFGREDLLTLNEDEQQERFKSYSALWDTQGIYVALQAFLRDFRVRSVLLGGDFAQGERILTNLTQLIEILHKTQTGNKFNNGELISWLQKGIEGMAVEGDEFEQRIESDEEAIRIITIHKSKGLEYPIVFAPYLDMLPEGIGDFCSFRDRDSGEYLFAHKEQLNDDQAALLSEQLEQENRRMIYVAVTRAVYKCYIFRNTASYYNRSSLRPFITALKTLPAANCPVQFGSIDTIPVHGRYSGKPVWKPLLRRELPDFSLADQRWCRISYTFLAKKLPYIPQTDDSLLTAPYDAFVFKQLPRGLVTGNMLHYILEQIDFTQEGQWRRVVAAALRRFIPSAGDAQLPMYLELVRHLVNADITAGGPLLRLSSVGRGQRVSELEFDFHTGDFVNTDLLALAGTGTTLALGYEVQLAGMMNGKIDLVFVSEGKYYILDWKSNFLGDQLAFYTADRLAQAMDEHNYHLQYLIYTLALKKYLTVRVPGFDYERDFGGVIYLFLRGVRAGGGYGVFTARPPLAQIAQLEQILTGGDLMV